ncbi:MAG: PP2C family protein-serine/threonine phosphatase [Gammaproteobacteria bacterium]
MHILVIDDDPAIGDELARCLAGAAGRAVSLSFAADDTAALGLLHGEARFDLAMVSIDGGAVSGLGLFRRLLERSLRVPRIALTDGSNIERVRRAFTEGAADFLVKPLRTDDFIATLARVMDRVERRRRDWRERAAYSALRRELDIAADMQQRILPHQFPARDGLDVAAKMRPARGIGGDFYDVFAIDRRQLGVLIADVSGKGIPAAFYMAIASTALRSVGMTGAAPAACLAEVNDFLVGRDIPGMFVSVFYAVLDSDDYTLRMANAGHPPPLLHDGGTAAALDCDGGPVLGILAGQSFGESRRVLAPGEALLLYTDGVTEASDPTRRQLGLDGLLELLGGVDNGAAALVERIERGVGYFTGGNGAHDDVTALVLARHGP